ncbi:MAG: tetratricopeptide repeat protein [Polyangiaceae bacterium]|nr:tetratricopeptide repeat protein [Polyangiaceae bacterium]
MTTSSLPPNQSGPPDATKAQAAAWITEELDAATDDRQRALLLHERAALLLRSGDDAGAARDFLAAFNADDEFREPLEALVALLGRRRSVQNLGKLLEALEAAASTPDEVARAKIDRAAFALEKGDVDLARSLLREATVEREGDLAPWLELEILAGKEGDAGARREALAARAPLAAPPAWRALLLLDLAQMDHASGDREAAIAGCRAAVALEGATRFRALTVLVDLARDPLDDAALAEALEALAHLVVEALEDADAGARAGVPVYARTPAFAAEAWVRAAMCKRRLGDLDGAAALLVAASEKLPDEPALAMLELGVRDAQGDGARSAEIARALIERGAPSDEAASLWMRVEEEAAGRGDRDGALAALAAAVAADPSSLLPRVMHLDFLSLSDEPADHAQLAAMVEASADLLGADDATARAYLRAAWEWAVSAKDAAGAKAALSQAGLLGVPHATVARLGRLLARLSDDAQWYDDATRRLLAAGPPEAELPGLWLELVRGRLARGEHDGAAKAVEQLSQAPGGAWIARALAAYVLPAASPKEGRAALDAAALDALAAVETDAPTAGALRLVAARRALGAGDVDGANQRLGALLEEDASNLLAASFRAAALRGAGRLTDAAAVLDATAAALDDRALSACSSLEAGLLWWRAAERESALQSFRAAHAADPDSAAPMLAWATRAVSPDDLGARREAIDSSLAGGESPALASLERLGLELGPGGDADDARVALVALENDAGPLAIAGALARVCWPAVVGDRDRLEAALSALQSSGYRAAALAHEERLRISRDYEADLVAAARHAAAWSAASGELPAALEWHAASRAVDDQGGVAGALRLAAASLSGEAAIALSAHAAMVDWLASGSAPPVDGDTHAADLVNLELAPTGCDPRRRALALRALERGALGDDAGVDALLLAGYSHLAEGAPVAALDAFRRVTDARAQDLAAWEGVRAAGEAIGDPSVVADACVKLGELCSDDARGAAWFEQAGVLYIDALDDPNTGEQALLAAFERDPTRVDAFDKLFRRLRARDADDAVLQLAQRRLEVTEDTPEIVKLYWEQARILRKQGDYEGAQDALSNVTMLEADHVGALALSGEIFIKKGEFAEAAAALSRLALHEEAPPQQRLISGVAAVDLYEKKLDRVDEALRVLTSLHESGLSTLPVRERLATVAARAEAWPAATAILEELMGEREGADARVAAARLSMAIWRDKLDDPRGAERAVTKLLAEAPSDGEALDLLLDRLPTEPFARRLVATGRDAVVRDLAGGPLDPDAVARLAKIARATGDGALLQASLGALVALGRDEPGVSDELADLDARAARVPQIQVDDAALAALGDPEDSGPIARLFAALGETIAEALGPSREGLGVGRKERIDAKSGMPLRNDVAAWLGALGIGEFELYVGGRDLEGVQGVAGEVPAIVVGGEVRSPLSPRARAAVAREAFALRRGPTIGRLRDEATIASIAIAACNLCELRLDAPNFAILGDVQRQLGKAMSRKVKKMIPEICQEMVARRADVVRFSQASQRSLDRVAAIAGGDAALVLTDVLGASRGDLRRAVAASPRADRLLRFVLSPTYLQLRSQLGMGVR